MPELDGKSYEYNKAGYKAYIKALKKKRKKKKMGVGYPQQEAPSGPAGGPVA
tara:strand:- start:411 stop:566 length:156 start_codon:yes stop_codon:yes gene_type:complete